MVEWSTARTANMASDGENPPRGELLGNGGPKVNQDFGGYRLIRQLGRGAQGVVYLAEDREQGRQVALKVLAGSAIESPEHRDRFEREASVTAKLNHPGICRVLDVGQVEGVPYIAMQYLQGEPLSSLIEESRPQVRHDDSTIDHEPWKDEPDVQQSWVSIPGATDVQDVVRMIERVARALHVAHESGLVHRDIKPGNVMVTPEGDPVLLDFGLARDLDADGQTLTRSGQILGTPAYLAPEQIKAARDEVDRRTDVYALGVMLYECLTLTRPFEAPTWDKLFHKILTDDPTDPRKLNPRIPKDLRTVIDTAMDREPRRRYQNANELANDLKRVRRFEQIVAKPPGPILRLRKWARRRPAVAVAVAAVALVSLFAVARVTYQSIQLGRSVEERLRSAEAALADGRHDDALQDLAWVKAQGVESVRAVQLRGRIEVAVEAEAERVRREERRAEAFASATAAREEAAIKLGQYLEIQADFDALEIEIERERKEAFSGYAPPAVRGGFARREGDLVRRGIEAERALQEAQEALQRAERLEAPWGDTTPETRAALADFYFRRWERAIERDDAYNEPWLRSAVQQHDTQGRYRAAMLGRGTLEVAVQPADAEIYLFRYESRETLRDGEPIPRLVPVPTSGVGRLRPGAWADGFAPGDPCLVVTGVAEGSAAAEAGLRQGDLIIGLDGHPCDGGLFALGMRQPEPREPDSADTDSPLVEAGIPALARIRAVNESPVGGRFDWFTAPGTASGIDRVRFVGHEGEVELDRRLVIVLDAATIIQKGVEHELRLTCLRGGKPVQVDVAANAAVGVECALTAYPLILCADNRIEAGAELVVDPGSYLVYARRQGFESQPCPVLVERNGGASCSVALLDEGATPAGYVYVPPGPVLLGGDPDAHNAGVGSVQQVDGFLIAEKELTTEEWFAFVNDPPILEQVEASRAAGELKLLPREISGPIAEERPEGGWTWKEGAREATPVFGISWNDVQVYLEWRNAHAVEEGEPWIYDLPTAAEWERAARGPDGRSFPWGNRFDFGLTVGLHSLDARLRRSALPWLPGGFWKEDVSPFGVLDMGGSRREWLREVVPGLEGEAASAYTRGGAWSEGGETVFRSAGRAYATRHYAGGDIGLRLVLRPRP